MKAVSSSRMKKLDMLAQKRFGIPELILMEHAGIGVAAQALRLAGRSGRQVAVFCGGGANGGDGFVAARLLDNAGISVQVVLFADPARISGAARVNFDILRKLEVPVALIPSSSAWAGWARRHAEPGLVIDALLGTGFSGEVREPIRSAIEWINVRHAKIISVDIPSGLSADTGKPSPVAVKADVTVTCGLPKTGLLNAAGRRYTGQLAVADISLPRKLRNGRPVSWNS